MIGKGGVYYVLFLLFCSIGYGISVFGTDIEQVNDGLVLTSTSSTAHEASSNSAVSSTQVLLLDTDIFINEIMVQPNEPEKEWIELYNENTNPIDISGWILSDEVGIIATMNETIVGKGIVIIDLEKTALNNTGDGVFLKHNGTIIHSLVYGNAKSAVRDIDQVPGLGNTIVRDIDGGFFVSHTPTKGEKNSAPSITILPVTNTSTPVAINDESVTTTIATSIPYGLIVINEFVSDPADNVDEFIELFHTGEVPVSLNGWYIEDGSETKTMLVGSIAPKGFFVIEKPKGVLNNAGDEIILYTAEGKEIDRVIFGTWDDGNIGDNAPVAKDPYSAARRIDGGNTQNNAADFVITNTITKGAPNEVSLVIVEFFNVEAEQVVDKKIIINEIFPNPKGSDTEGEFIEVKNISSESISLAGWKIGDGSTTRYTLPEITIKSGGHLVFFRRETKISLNNSGTETVRLFTASGALADSIVYDGVVAEDQSFARNNDGIFLWSVVLTPGEENTIVVKNNTPEISVSAPKTGIVGEPLLLDASDTSDDEHDPLLFSWFINNEKIAEGELVQYTFTTSGKQVVELRVIDGAQNEAKKDIKITIKEGDVVPIAEGEIAWVEGDMRIIISEAWLDPEGSDATEEFVEIYNNGEYEVDLGGWLLDDIEGGSRPYVIPDGTIIGPKQLFVFYRDTTNIALNNTEDAVRLLFPNKTIVDQVVVSDVVSEAAYMKTDTGEWVWSSEPTPGEANKFVAVALEERDKKVKGKDGNIIIKTTISELKDHENGDAVMVQGTVAVKPGVFGTTIFYIVDGAGVQITMPKKYMPAVEIGDRVEVIGTLGESKGERRISVKKKEDLRLVGAGVAPEVPKEEMGSIVEERIGSLLMVEGEVVEKKGTSLYIDDGTGELLVTLPKGIKTKEAIKVGDIIDVRGIVRLKTDEIYLMPRMSEDIQKIGVVASIESEPELEFQKEKKNMLPYFMITGAATAIIGTILAVRKRMGKSSVE